MNKYYLDIGDCSEFIPEWMDSVGAIRLENEAYGNNNGYYPEDEFEADQRLAEDGVWEPVYDHGVVIN